MMKKRNLVSVFIAQSLDGFIADKNGSVSFLNEYQDGNQFKPNQDYGYAKFIENKKAIVLGANTYNQLLEMKVWMYGEREVYVVTSRKLELREHVTLFNGKIKELFDKLKNEDKGVYVDGGAQLIQSCLREGLIDELLGEGIPLFSSVPEQKLKLVGSTAFDDGLVQVHYEIPEK